MNVTYASEYEDVKKVIKSATEAGERGDAVGLDTEFYGVDVGKQNCYARAQVHFLSLAIPRYPLQVNGRGLPVCDAYVFTSEVLQFREVVSWLQSDAPKAIHNMPVDVHSLANHGIEVGGGINTLAMSRWAWPQRARAEGFTLDSLGEDFLRIGKTESFDELFSEEYEDLRSTYRKVRICECGQNPCRKRQTQPGHTRIIQSVETVHSSIKTRPVPIQTVVRGHALWDRALAYSARDAVLALLLYYYALQVMEETTREVPWL